MSSWAPSCRPTWADASGCAHVAEALLAAPPRWSQWPFARPSVEDLAMAIQAHPSHPLAVLRHLEALDRDAWVALREAILDSQIERLNAVHAQAEAHWVAQQGLQPVFPLGHRLADPWNTTIRGHDQTQGRYLLDAGEGQWRSVPYEALHGLTPSPARFALRAPPSPLP